QRQHQYPEQAVGPARMRRGRRDRRGRRRSRGRGIAGVFGHGAGLGHPAGYSDRLKPASSPAAPYTAAVHGLSPAGGSPAMSEAHLFAIGVLLAWLAGIRVYLTVFGVGIAGLLGWLDLPPALQVAASPWVIGVSGALAVTEFFADKIPGVD